MDFKDKKVTVVGLGLHGGGLAAVNWLVKHGAEVTVTDLKTEAELKPSLEKIKDLRACRLVLGRHREADFKTADIIMQNPGVPRELRYLKVAKKAGAKIFNDASIFLKHCPAPVVGVTGTRGKSTTASLICETLKHGYEPRAMSLKQKSPKPPSTSFGAQSPPQLRSGQAKPKTFLAGLPQKPLLEILDKIKPQDLVVLELSSWQLEILGEQRLSPKVAVITNIFPDHLNRYLGMKDYIKAKKNIFLFQKTSDFCVLNRDNPETKKMEKEVKSRRLWFSQKNFLGQNGALVKNNRIYFRQNGKESPVCPVKDVKLPGAHNLQNALAAVAVAGTFGVAPAKIRQVLKSFSGLPFRLELTRELKGVKFVNDTTATTPDGTLAALKLKAQGPGPKAVILIAGGETKNIPDAKYKELAKLVEKTCKAVVLFRGRGSQQLLKFLKIKNLVSEAASMAEAVGLAQSFAKKGDVVLLSPACASFNMFVNEFDRGEQFNQAVKSLKH